MNIGMITFFGNAHQNKINIHKDMLLQFFQHQLIENEILRLSDINFAIFTLSVIPTV